MDPWLTHKWLPPEGRPLAINGKSITQHFYVACKREFVEDTSAGERYAVHALVLDFTRLADEVNARWLTEPCPGMPVPSVMSKTGRLNSTACPEELVSTSWTAAEATTGGRLRLSFPPCPLWTSL